MSNNYIVTEKGKIFCACGGKVVLKSTNPNMVIAGVKPLYWQDILSADIVGCRSSSPCTKVVTITSAGTQDNVGDLNDTFLLRVDGFKTDKGRELILNSPGQHESSIFTTPTAENSVVEYNKEAIENSKPTLKDKEEAKYRLYFLRKSNNKLKPLRPTRAFRNSKELSQIEDETLETYQVYTHTFAYLYITQDEEIKEYQVAYKGQAYSEKIEDIYYIGEFGELSYIPIETDSKVDISYSNFKLDISKDKAIIKKLEKNIIYPKKLGSDKTKAFYTNSKNSLKYDEIEINSETYKTFVNYEPNFEANIYENIFCVIDDVLGEIEDRYFELENSFKYAYKLNNSYIVKVEEINSYPVTITSILDYFYVRDEEEKLLKTLEEKYKKLVEIYLTDKNIISKIFVKNETIIINKKEKLVSSLDWIFDSSNSNNVMQDVGLSYLLKFKQIKYDFFEEPTLSRVQEERYSNIYANKTGFKTLSSYSNNSIISAIYYTDISKSKLNSVVLNNSDSKFTQIKQNANELLACVIFETIFSQNFDSLLNTEILNLGKQIDEILQKLRPIPYLNEDNKKDLRKVIDKNEIYKNVLSQEGDSSKDSYLEDYAGMDLVCRKNSFAQDGKVVEKLFKTNYLFFPKKEQSNDEKSSLLEKLFKLSQDNEVKFYKKAKDNSELRFPKDILDDIKALLVSTELKYILDIYKQIEYEKDEDKLSYILGLKNIVHLLCASRLNIDEEQEINNIFNPELKHILEFEEYIIEQIKTLDEDTIVKKITDYKINQAYAYLLQKSYIFALLKGGNFKINAEKFKEDYKKEANEIEKEIDKQNEPKLHRFVEVEKIKIIKDSYEFIKNVEGITSKVEEALDKILKNKDLPDQHNTILKYQASLKNFSTVVAVLSVYKFLVVNDNKTLLDCANFANDTIVLFKAVNSVLKISNGMKESDFIKAVINKLKSKNLFLNVINPVRLSIFMQIIITVLETADYQEKRDYTATNLTLFSSSLIIIGGFVSTPLLFAGIVLLIARGLLESSELVVFLNRTILAIDKKKYKPYFLNEAFKKSDKNIYLELATPKELIEFIGNNYKNNKEIFNLAFRNELQFLYTTLVGMKLEIDERVTHRIIGVRGVAKKLYKKTILKIPALLVDDDKFQLILNDFSFLKNKEYFNKEGDYYLFDLDKIELNSFEKNILNANNVKNANLEIISSIVNLKYSFIYDADITTDPMRSCYLNVKYFKQTNFNK